MWNLNIKEAFHNLKEWDKKWAKKIQEKFKLTDYQMLCLAFGKGFIIGAILLQWQHSHYIMKKALITGITGQDGSYLAELLLSKGYQVHGIVRRASLINTHRIDHIYEKLKLHYGDLTDSVSIMGVIKEVEPCEIYNLGAQSHVKVSFKIPEYTGQVDAMGTLRVLEAVRMLGMEKDVRIYQASTSELYGGIYDTALTETTPFHPRSPY